MLPPRLKPPSQTGGGGKLFLPPLNKSAECNDLQTPVFESEILDDLAERPNGGDETVTETPSSPPESLLEPDPDPELETVPVTVALLPEGQVNFDTSLEAALFYVRDGWAIIPCREKKPLIGGKVKRQGHTAACRDKGKIADYFTEDFPGAGVAIRLDGHILLDFDVKDGKRGIDAYELLDATFSLPATLMARTPTGGLHLIFKLPDGLPENYIGNWTELLNGFDIKTGVGGLCHVEPTVTRNGIYRWVDPTAEIAELPRAVCDYIHELHEQQQRVSEKIQHDVGFSARPFDPNEDQARYFKDAPNGKRHPRLRTIACSLAAHGADAKQIVTVLQYHDRRFTEPTNDVDFMLRVAAGAVQKFGQEVAQ